MSYRTYINGVQVFGNGEYYQEWLDFVRSKGIKVDEEQGYEGDIVDFMEALDVVESITLRLNRERNKHIQLLTKALGANISPNLVGEIPKNLFDMTNIPKKIDPDCSITLEESIGKSRYGTSLLDELMNTIDNAYAFLPYSFYKACESVLERTNVFSSDRHFHCFKVKEGEKIHIKAG